MTKYRCLNCPDKPTFLDLDQLKDHWSLTHVVAMEITIVDPWGERPPKVRALYEVVPDPVASGGP